MPNYNNYFPIGYQPLNPYQYQPQVANTYQPQLQQTVQVPQQPNTGIIWVQGEAGAKAYPVASGTSILLMDSENECFYIKSTDISGMPLPLRTFDYREHVANSQNTLENTQNLLVETKNETKRYVTHEELEQRLNALKEQSNTHSRRRERMYDGE